jgi:hypothetical protein
MSDPIAIIGLANSRDVLYGSVRINPRESQRLINHSPDGFSWGYGGSGPSQLALAILLMMIDEEDALRLYQDFKWKFIAGAPQHQDLKILVDDVRAWIAEQS